MTTGKLRIAVLGAGNIGGTLGRKWAGAGHQVAFTALPGHYFIDTTDSTTASTNSIVLALPP